MSRKSRTPEEQARREKIRALLQESNVTSMEDIQNLFKETIAEFMENGLEAELDGTVNMTTRTRRRTTAVTVTATRISAPALAMLRFQSPVIAKANLSRSSSRRTRPASARTLRIR